MTPIMLGKRLVKQISDVVTDYSGKHMPLPPNHMNIHRSVHPVPSELVYAFGPKVIKDLRLRTGFTVNIESISGGGESHKHSWSAFKDRRACLMIYIGENPTELGYTDPRNNEFHYKTISTGDTFILSTHHNFHYNNVHSSTEAVYVTVNGNLSWEDTVRHWQHTW